MQLRRGDGVKQAVSGNCLLRGFQYEKLVQSSTKCCPMLHVEFP